MERFFVKQIEKLIRYTTKSWGRIINSLTLLRNKVKEYPPWVYPSLVIILCVTLILLFYFRFEISLVITQDYIFVIDLISKAFFYPKKFLGFIYSIASSSLFSVINFIKILYTKVFSENSPIYFLFPFAEKFIAAFNELLLWYLERGWYYLLKWTLILVGSYAFYQWFMYTVPTRDEDYYLFRGATLMFIYRLRTYSFKAFYKTYSEPFYDGLMGIVIILGYTFYRQLWEIFVAYLKNSVFRSKVNRWFRRKLRKPFVWFFVRFNWFFYLISFVFQTVTITLLNFFKLIILISPKIFFIVSSLLFVFFCWLCLHKFIFDHVLFFIFKNLGIRFPRPSLGSQSTTLSFSGSSIFSKVSSSSVGLKLNSLVDLKNTNVYSVNNSFSKLTSVVYKKLKYKPSRKWSSIKGLISPLRSYSLYSKLKRSFFNANLVHKLNRFGYRGKFSRLQASTKRPLVSSGYTSKLRFLKLRGSIFFPKLVSNKLDLNTFVLRELLKKKYDHNFFDSFMSSNNKEESFFDFYYTRRKNLSVPNISLFNNRNFFFKINNKPGNRFFKNRNSNIFSDLFYPFLGYKLNRTLMQDPTFFIDSPFLKRRAGGSARYKDVDLYNLGRVSGSSKILNNFKIYGMFLRQNIKTLRLDSLFGINSLKRFQKESLYWKKAFFRKSFWRPFVRTAYSRNFRRLIRFKLIRAILSRGYRLSKKSRRIRVRFANPPLRKFIFTRFFFNKYNRNFSFYKKRHKIKYDAFYKMKNLKAFFVHKQKFNGRNPRFAVSAAVVGLGAVKRKNKLNYLSFRSSLISLRRYVLLLLKYRNKKKFFKHGTKFLLQSRLSKKINKGNRYSRKFFSNNNLYLSFLRSVYARNYRILLAVKLISDRLFDQEFSYLPLFHVLEKPWWHTNSLADRGCIGINFNKRSALGKLGFSLRRDLITNNFLIKYFIFYRRGRLRPLSKRYMYFGRLRRIRRKKNILSRWFKSRRVKYWFFSNYGSPVSIFITNFAKDYRKFLFDFTPSSRARPWRNKYFDVIPPLLFKYEARFYSRLWRYLKLLFYSFGKRSSSLSLFILFFFGLIFGSFPVF